MQTVSRNRLHLALRPSYIQRVVCGAHLTLTLVPVSMVGSCYKGQGKRAILYVVSQYDFGTLAVLPCYLTVFPERR